ADSVLEIAPRIVDARKRLIGNLATQRGNGQDGRSRTRAARNGMLDGTLHRLHTIARAMRHRSKLTDGFKNSGDVKIAVLSTTALNGPMARRDAIGRNISDDHHGRTAQGCFNGAKEPGRGGITTLRHKHPWSAREAAIHLGHARCRLLVARHHNFDLVLLMIQGFENTPGVATGNAKDMVNARFL